jgi:signal transduction histidine kinase/CheY-like chemotaxis protein
MIPAVPIRRSLTRIIVLASLSVVVVATLAFCMTEYVTFRRVSAQQLQILSQAIATNSTASLAFDNTEDATGILSAFKADPHITAAVLYDNAGRVFATYPAGSNTQFPRLPTPGVTFSRFSLSATQAVVEGSKHLGTLYVISDLSAMYQRLELFALIALLTAIVSVPLAQLISARLQRRLVDPLFSLADTARAVSQRQDYDVRARATGMLEFDSFVDTFNQMLQQIKISDGKLHEQLGRLNLLQQITRATGERQDLPSVFQVVLRTLEDSLPIDFGCFLLLDSATNTLKVASLGSAGLGYAQLLGLQINTEVPIDQNGLSRCLTGCLVYEPNLLEVPFAFPQRLAATGFQSVVFAPLGVEGRVFGVLVCAKRESSAFNSTECEFLRQLSEHVALASHQARLYGALQQAYDDLRQSQHAVMQQERLRALGQMASGIAHDINNAISPVSLYTESLLEREPNLSERTRSYLTTIQGAIVDVARTVARMREFYRERETEITLQRVDINRAVRHVVELTKPRWNDLPQQRGIMIELKTELADPLPEIMGAENEIRDALTNLIFNAVDAMPSGGMLTIETTIAAGADGLARTCITVRDTGVGMDEDTRRRCLEPFYTTKGERGTGLGLAMVYGMIQRHGAELKIDSAVAQGTAIGVQFPVASEALATDLLATKTTVINRRLRILLIDDDPLLIKSLQDTLQQDGHVLSACHGGQAGIDTFTAFTQRGESFDLVITDLGMPHVDGRKVASSIKHLSAGTPVILLTGWGQRIIAEKDTPAHVDKVLSKPPRLHELRAAFLELVA